MKPSRKPAKLRQELLSYREKRPAKTLSETEHETETEREIENDIEPVNNNHSKPLVKSLKALNLAPTPSLTLTMLPTTIHASLSAGDFVTLSEYQSTTPASFHGGKPVLHYHAKGAKAWLPKDQLEQSKIPIFPTDAPVFEGDAGEMISQDEIELFINSEYEFTMSMTRQLTTANKYHRNLTIFNNKTSTGIQIPYPSIALHAMQHKADPSSDRANETDAELTKAPCVLLQLDLSDGGDDDETFDTLQLTLIPPVSSTDLSSPAQEGSASPTEQEKLFDAITACQNLHPDPLDDDDQDDDEEDYADRIVFESAVDGSSEAIEGLPGAFRGSASGDLPPPMPGSSGWITAENVADYFDGDGNWIGGGGDDDDDDPAEELGEGAGRVRARDEINGHDGAEGDAENKRPRTE